MKSLISDHDYELQLGGTAKSGVQKTLGRMSGSAVGFEMTARRESRQGLRHRPAGYE
jgi:hypothetical protein